MCIDDVLHVCAENCKQLAYAANQLIFRTLEQAGFSVHPVKSVREPTQHLTWLGLIIDMALGQIEVPQCKIAAVCKMLKCIKQASQVKAKCLASVLGKIM